MEKGFFKVFNPETSAKRMKIPTGHTNYKNGKLPRNVFLRDRFNNIWPMGVTRIGRDLYFQYGWEKFIEDNNLEFGDFIIFDYDGNETFDFKLLGITGCVKEGAKCEKKEKVNVEHRKSVELKEKNRTRDNNDSSFDDDNIDNYMIEEEDNDKVEVEKEENEDDDEEGAEKEIEEEVEEGKNDETEEEVEEGKEDETEEEEDEEENGTTNTFKKKTSGSKAGRRKAITCKVRNTLDRYGADIFKSGRATQPKNPYFVAKILPKRRNQLYVPIDVVRDYKLELPPSMTIRDSAGREFETRVNNWKDGRIWLMGGWRSICRWNLVEENDKLSLRIFRYKENIHRPVMGESVERGWYDHRKIGQPSTSEASRAIKAAKMFMPVNPYLQILEKYIIYGIVFWYDDAAIYSKNFSKNGLERITCDLCLLRYLFLNTVSSCPRYRNFERLHSHLKDIPNYTLHLLPKRIFSSSTEYAFVYQHCIQLYKYLQCGIFLVPLPRFAQIFTWYLNSYDLDRPQQGSPMLVVGLSGGWIMFKAIDSEKLLSVLGRDLINVDDAVDDTVRQFKGVSDGLMRKVFGSPSSSSYDPTTSTSDRNFFWNVEEIHELALTQSNSESVNSFSDNDSSDKDGSHRDEEVGPSSVRTFPVNKRIQLECHQRKTNRRASRHLNLGIVPYQRTRIPADFLRHISEESPDRATLKCLSGGTWNVKLQCDGRGLAYTQRLEKFQKNNQLQNGEYLVFRYDGALQFTIRIFSKNGLERQVKSPNMVKNQQASIYDGGSKRKRPEKYPYASKFPKQTRAYCENDTEHATPRKRAALEKEEDLLTDLTPNIPQFVKCLKGSM
ncbi:hypothetical protein KY290_004320 [Solanum tuberosum]|uniref:TF-B3 domain-containing protein n=1 Tax=Solanum tuberosum TaxID=4113 RepID=A0ABQ7WVF3_SOLTU|nr:hypothetical protein KY290_004320 [Solanum tuberosum]